MVAFFFVGKGVLRVRVTDNEKHYYDQVLSFSFQVIASYFKA